MIHFLYCSAGYLPKAQRCLESVQKYQITGTHHVVFGTPDDYKYYDGIKPEFVPTDEKFERNMEEEFPLFKSTPYYAVLTMSKIGRHIKDDEPVIMQAMDVIMERPIKNFELQSFFSIHDNQVMMGYNCGANDNLYDEWSRLNPKRALTQEEDRYKSLRCLNGSLVIATKKTFLELAEKTKLIFNLYDHVLRHYAKIQWCFNYVLAQDNKYFVHALDYNQFLFDGYPHPDFIKNKPILFKHTQV